MNTAVVKGFFCSSIGRKAIMGISGLALSVFIVLHLSGNLLVYRGPEALNAYAAGLKGIPAVLWAARIGLLVFVLAHIGYGLSLAKENSAARPVKYAMKKPIKSTLASRYMAQTGIVLLAFILFHLAHFTLFWVHPEYHELKDALGHHDVYAMVVNGFSNGAVAGFYILSMLLLGLHLRHGLGSWDQSIGLKAPRFYSEIGRGALVIALLIMIGNISIPLSVLLGFVGPR